MTHNKWRTNNELHCLTKQAGTWNQNNVMSVIETTLPNVIDSTSYIKISKEPTHYIEHKQETLIVIIMLL